MSLAFAFFFPDARFSWLAPNNSHPFSRSFLCSERSAHNNPDVKEEDIFSQGGVYVMNPTSHEEKGLFQSLGSLKDFRGWFNEHKLQALGTPPNSHSSLTVFF